MLPRTHRAMSRGIFDLDRFRVAERMTTTDDFAWNMRYTAATPGNFCPKTAPVRQFDLHCSPAARVCAVFIARQAQASPFPQLHKRSGPATRLIHLPATASRTIYVQAAAGNRIAPPGMTLLPTGCGGFFSGTPDAGGSDGSSATYSAPRSAPDGRRQRPAGTLHRSSLSLDATLDKLDALYASRRPRAAERFSNQLTP